MSNTPAKTATRAVRAGIDCDPQHGAVVPPIHLSSTYAFAEFGVKGAYDYSRSGNPTRDQLGEAIAALEHGAGAVITGSGMAAISTVLQLAGPGARVVATHDCYGGTWRLLDTWAKQRRFTLELVDLTDPKAAREALSSPLDLLWIETPSNPLLRISDIESLAELAHRSGAAVVVDNTFLSPLGQQPLTLGADVVVHSTTKYINGHSDVVGGAIVAREPELAEQLAWWANCLGTTASPFDSWLTLRGVRTLGARLRLHEENTRRLVDVLVSHPLVSQLYWPGLSSHPGHVLARRQQSGFGAMLSFELQGGEPAARAFVDGLRYITLAESLGGVESLIAHPATMTHAAMSAEARANAGISDGLLRLSVGIEDAADLCADIGNALERATTALITQRRVAV
jgi:cystathionine gamma-synthase